MKDREVLIPLVKSYTKYECVLFLLKKVRQYRFRIGELTSERDELIHEKKQLKNKIESQRRDINQLLKQRIKERKEKYGR